MDSDVLQFAQVAVIVVFVIASIATIGVLTARAVLRMRRQAPPAAQLSNDKLEQLQQSIDAVAVEVERIAEAQRFSAKLLAERGEAQAAPASARRGFVGSDKA
jgi:hypothetical protein